MSRGPRRPPAAPSPGPPCTPAPPSAATGDPSGPLGAPARAWRQTRGWGRLKKSPM